MIENKIEEISGILQGINSQLGSITEKNTESELKKVKILIDKLSVLRENLLKEYNISQLKKYEQNLLKITKLINQKFDNVIKENKLRQSEILLQLKEINNHKKLITYSR